MCIGEFCVPLGDYDVWSGLQRGHALCVCETYCLITGVCAVADRGNRMASGLS